MDKILLIDGMNFIWRASVGFSKTKEHIICNGCSNLLDHDLGNLHCKCGSKWSYVDNKCENYDENHIIIFTFFRNLRPIIELFSPQKCFFVLEGHPKFRHDIYAKYKANRIIKTAEQKSSREKIFKASEDIIRLLQLLPLTIVKANDYEADDVIYTLCENLKDEDLTVISSDTDYIQLLQNNYKKFKLYNSIKKEFINAPDYNYVVWKCLAGDKTDNIPSLLKPRKVEPTVRSPDLLSKFLDLEENRANFNINRQLIEFKKVPEEDLLLLEGVASFKELKEEFSNMKFESIINDKSWSKYKSTFSCLRF